MTLNATGNDDGKIDGTVLPMRFSMLIELRARVLQEDDGPSQWRIYNFGRGWTNPRSLKDNPHNPWRHLKWIPRGTIPTGMLAFF